MSPSARFSRFFMTVALVYTLAILATVCISARTDLLSRMTWRLPVGVFSIATGIVTVHGARTFLPSGEHRYLRNSMILSPSVSMICAGVNLFTWDAPQLKLLFDLTLLLAILSFALAFPLLRKYKEVERSKVGAP